MKQRASKVAEELRKIISMALIGDLSDPRMGFVTITHIEVTDDLRFARVFYSVLGDESKKHETEEAFKENHNFLRRLAVEKINMKFAMDLRFELDKTIDESFKLDKIFKKIHQDDEKIEPDNEKKDS